MKHTVQHLQTYFDTRTVLTQEELDYAYKIICFLQHERLVHLLVTLFTFAGIIVLGVLSLAYDTLFFRVTGVTALVLLLFYVHYYYYLENSVQELYQKYINAQKQ